MTDSRSYEYYNSLFRGKDLPLAWLDLDLLKRNISEIRERASGKSLRVASKSIRCPYVLRTILESGPPYQGIMSFTVPESLFLLEQGFDDILLGYPCVNERQLERLVQASASGKTIIPMTDSEDHFRLLDRIANDTGHIQPICIDIDMSSDFPGIHFGVYRSPINSLAKFRALLDCLPRYPNIKLTGIMGYEAQIAGLGDTNPASRWQNPVIGILKKRSIAELAKRRKEAVELARERGYEVTLVNGGGTGSMGSTGREDCVTEITVGSGFYSPVLFDHYKDFHYAPAAGYALEIVRMPKNKMYTALGGGYVASGSPGSDKQPQPYLPQEARLIPTEGAGEVQTPFTCPGSKPLKTGDTLLMRHAKAGELCERFNELHVISEGRIVDVVPTYRGMGKCFL